MIQVYSENNKNFSSNGDMTLLPEDASVSVELNGSWNLTMQHPIDKKGRWKYLEEGAVIKAPSFNGEQLFRIYKKEKSEGGTSVEAYPIFFDSKNDCFLTDIRPTGKNGQEALNIMLAPNKKYSAQSDIAKSTTACRIIILLFSEKKQFQKKNFQEVETQNVSTKEQLIC